MDNQIKLALLLSSLIGVTACGSDDTSTVTSNNLIKDEYEGVVTIPPADNEEPISDEEPIGDGEPVEAQENIFLNGDFESWTAGQPDDWTTIDSGITVAQSNDITYQGTSSGQVLVTTGEQGSTDLRQYVHVVAGTTYKFTAWFYHTEGYVRTTLFAGSFKDNVYSNQDLINEWQELTYSYTATETTAMKSVYVFMTLAILMVRKLFTLIPFF